MSKVNYNEPFELPCLVVFQAAPNAPNKEISVKCSLMWEDVVRLEEFFSPIITTENRTLLYTRQRNEGIIVLMPYHELLELWTDFKKSDQLGMFKSHN